MTDDTDDDTLGPLLERVIGESIDAAVGQHERALVTKWVALVETIDGDGERGLWTMTSVRPVADVIAHEFDDCVCGPLTEPVVDEGGSVLGFVVVHASLDGRENHGADVHLEEQG